MAGIHFNLTAEDARAVSAMTKVIDKMREAEGAAKRTGNSGEMSFSGIVAKAGSVVSAYVSIQAAIDAYTAGIRLANQMEDEGIASLEASIEARQRLAQVAKSPEQVADLQKFTEQVRVQYGLAADQATRMVADLTSAGAKVEEIGTFALLPQGPELLRSTALASKAFGGDQVGSLRQLVNESLAIASDSMPFSEELLANVAKAAPFARMAGATDEQTMALMGVIGSARKDSRVASTEVAAIFKEMEDEHVSMDKGLPAALAKMQKLVKSGKIKESRAIAGIDTAMANLPMLQSLIGAAEAASAGTGEGDLASQYAQKFLQGADLQLLKKRSAEQRVELLKEKEAMEGGIEEETVKKQIVSASREFDEPWRTTAWRETAAGWAEQWGGGKEEMLQAADVAGVVANLVNNLPAVRLFSGKESQRKASEEGETGWFASLMDKFGEKPKTMSGEDLKKSVDAFDAAASRFIDGIAGKGQQQPTAVSPAEDIGPLALLPQGKELLRATELASKGFGADQVGSLRQMVNEAIAVASESMPFSEELLANVATAAPFARKAGATDEQTMALMGVIGSARNDATAASTEVASIFKEMRQQGISMKGGLPAALTEMQGLIATGTITEPRATAGVDTALANLSTLQSLIGAAEASSAGTGEGDLASQYVQKIMQGADLQLLQKRSAEQRADEGPNAAIGKTAAGRPEEWGGGKEEIASADNVSGWVATLQNIVGASGEERKKLEVDELKKSVDALDESVRRFAQGVSGAKLQAPSEDIGTVALSSKGVGADKVGSLRQTGDESRAVASESMPFSEELLSKAAPFARMAGANDEQTMALMGVIGSARKDSKIASTEVAAIFKEMDAEGVSMAGGLPAALTKMQDLVKSGKITDARAVAGIDTAIANLPMLQSLIEAASAGAGEGDIAGQFTQKFAQGSELQRLKNQSAEQRKALEAERAAEAVSAGTGEGDLSGQYAKQFMQGADLRRLKKQSAEQQRMSEADRAAMVEGIDEDIAKHLIPVSSIQGIDPSRTKKRRQPASDWSERFGGGKEDMIAASGITAERAAALQNRVRPLGDGQGKGTDLETMRKAIETFDASVTKFVQGVSGSKTPARAGIE